MTPAQLFAATLAAGVLIAVVLASGIAGLARLLAGRAR